MREDSAARARLLLFVSIAERLVELLARSIQQECGLGGLGVQLLAREAQRQRERDEALLGSVV